VNYPFNDEIQKRGVI